MSVNHKAAYSILIRYRKMTAPDDSIVVCNRKFELLYVPFGIMKCMTLGMRFVDKFQSVSFLPNESTLLVPTRHWFYYYVVAVPTFFGCTCIRK